MLEGQREGVAKAKKPEGTYKGGAPTALAKAPEHRIFRKKAEIARPPGCGEERDARNFRQGDE
jgi:hypothetical protein